MLAVSCSGREPAGMLPAGEFEFQVGLFFLGLFLYHFLGYIVGGFSH